MLRSRHRRQNQSAARIHHDFASQPCPQTPVLPIPFRLSVSATKRCAACAVIVRGLGARSFTIVVALRRTACADTLESVTRPPPGWPLLRKLADSVVAPTRVGVWRDCLLMHQDWISRFHPSRLVSNDRQKLVCDPAKLPAPNWASILAAKRPHSSS